MFDKENGSSPMNGEKKGFFDRLVALPWRKFALVVVLLFIGYVLSLLVSCSTVRVVGNNGESRVKVNQSALDSAQIVVEFLNPK